jgi:hypothetical protein
MNPIFLILLCAVLIFTSSAEARIVDGTEEKQDGPQEIYYLTQEQIESALEAEELSLRDLEIRHEKNIESLPVMDNFPEGQENSDEIRKLALFIIKMMLEGNYELHDRTFSEEYYRTFFGQRAYNQVRDFIKESADTKQDPQVYYLLDTQCVPKIEEVSVGRTSKRWQLSLVTDYVRINDFEGNLLMLDSDLIPPSSKRNRTRYLISMDIRNRKKENGKDKYQFRNVFFEEATEAPECSDREKLLHDISLHESIAIKARGRIKLIKKVLEMLETDSVIINKEGDINPVKGLDLHLP